MKGYNKPTDVNVEAFLMGYDDEEYIRDVSVSNYSNVAKVFTRSPQDDRARISEYSFTPFLWSKKLPDDVKNNFFRWKTVGIPLADYDNGEKIILDKKLRTIDDINVKYLGVTPDNEQHIFSWKLSDAERITYYKEKKREYGIEIQEQITYYNDQVPVDRMENGFKYLVKITTPKNPKYTSNPLFLWNSKGKKNKITGSFQNLINFYQEGGIDIYQKAAHYLNKEKLLETFNNFKVSERILFFFDIIHDLEALELNFFFEDFYDRDELFSFISKQPDLKQSILDNIKFSGEDIKFLKVNMLKLLKYANIKDILLKAYNEQCVEKLFPNVGINIELVNLFVSTSRNFRAKAIGRHLIENLKNKGIDIFDSYEKLFYTVSATEQFLIQSGKRLFKGVEDYSDLRIMVLDIETQAQPAYVNHPKAALDPEIGRIFKIGIYMNDGYYKVLDAKTNDEELDILTQTYDIIAQKDPDMFLTYNGESFDIPFMERRLELLGGVGEDKNGELSVEEYIRNIFYRYSENEDVYISKYSLYNRRQSRLKVGGSTEQYTQTNSLGKIFCDTLFAVKRAQAQNNKIPNLKLKDNIKFAKIAKPNRVYVEGDKIGELENDNRIYFLNPNTGQYFVNNKNLDFYREDYSKDKLMRSKKGVRYYLTPKKLFIYQANCETQNSKILKGAENAFAISIVNEDGAIPSSLDEFKVLIDKSFVTLYDKLRNYDILVAPITGIGSNLRNTHPEYFEYLLNKLKNLRVLFEDVRQLYPNIDFSEYIETTGSEIVTRYLIDDLWETYQLDKIYSQATFEVAKWLPTTYQQAATMGTATIWKQLLTAWSYLTGIGIPDYEEERDFNGGLVGMVSSGFHKDIVKIDYSSLYPSKFLTDVDTPDIDISNIFKPFLLYALKTRLKFKGLKNEAAIQGNESDEGKYDKKQLPLKIIINSFYGMLGAPSVSPFAHIDSAHHITAGSRQGMRHIIRYFGQRGFKIIYFHTDGANFVIPKGVEHFTYIGLGEKNGGNWLVKTNREYHGVEAYVAQYNDMFMKGLMGLDIDDYAKTAINFSKGNFVYLKEKKDKKTGVVTEVVDYVGGAIVKKNQSEYIKDFLFDEHYNSLKVLLQGNLTKYINNYYDYLYKIIDHKIQAKKIASKARVTKDIPTYKRESKVRQAHMELAIQHNLNPVYGDWIFYVNVGEKASDSDFTVDKQKVGKIALHSNDYHEFEQYLKKLFHENRKEFQQLLYDFVDSEELILSKERVATDEGFSYQPKTFLIEDVLNWNSVSFKLSSTKASKFIEIIRHKEINNSRLLDEDDLDSTVVYNTEKYVDQFNAAIMPLWVAFDPEIRQKVITNKKGERPYFLSTDLTPCSGKPLEKKSDAQDDLNELLKTEPIEKELWVKKGLSPYWAFTRQKFNPNGFFEIDNNNLTYREIDEVKYNDCVDSNSHLQYVTTAELVDWLCENPFVDFESYKIKQLV